MKRFAWLFLLPLLLCCCLQLPVLATVPVVNPEISYTGDGVVTTYAYPFRAFAAADLVVTVDDVAKTLNVDYAVTGAGTANGGNVVFTVAPANAAAVQIVRNTPLNRTTNYAEGGPLRATTLNADVDRVVVQVQDLNNQTVKNTDASARSIKFPAGDATDPTLASIAERSGKLLSFDAAGKPTVISNLIGELPMGAIVENIAALRAMPAPTISGVTTYVQGYYSDGDGGGGMFTSAVGPPGAYVENTGTIIVTTGGDGSAAWLRQDSGAVNVLWFGVILDGLTDSYSGLQASLNYCKGTDIEWFHPGGTSISSAALDATRVRKARMQGKIRFTNVTNGLTIGTINNTTAEMSGCNLQFNVESAHINTAGTTGVTIKGIARSKIDIRSAFFEIGAKINPQSGTNQYFAFNDSWLELDSNRVALQFDHDTFANENTFYQVNAQRGSATLVPGIGIEFVAGSSNNNVFIRPNLENQPTPAAFGGDAANNLLLYARLESAGLPVFKDNAFNNKLETAIGNSAYGDPRPDYDMQGFYPNHVVAGPFGKESSLLTEITWRDFYHETATAGRNYFCPKLSAADYAASAKGVNYFNWATIDDAAKSFKITNYDKGYIIIPAANKDIFEFDAAYNYGAIGNPVATNVLKITALDASKAALGAILETETPYFGTSRGNRVSGTPNLGATLTVTAANLGSTKWLQVNRDEVKFLRFELQDQIEFYRFSLHAIHDRKSNGHAGKENPGYLDFKFIDDPTTDTPDRFGQIAKNRNSNQLYFSKGPDWIAFGYLSGYATFDPASLADGAGETTTVNVTGAAVGDFALASFSNDTQGILLYAWVSSAGVVSIRFQNETAGTVNLGSGLLRCRVFSK